VLIDFSPGMSGARIAYGRSYIETNITSSLHSKNTIQFKLLIDTLVCGSKLRVGSNSPKSLTDEESAGDHFISSFQNLVPFNLRIL